MKILTVPRAPSSYWSYLPFIADYFYFYGAAFFKEKHRIALPHNFVALCLTPTLCKDQRNNNIFCLPSQHDMDEDLIQANVLVAKRENLMVLKALSPSRGGPVKTARKRKEG